MTRSRTKNMAKRCIGNLFIARTYVARTYSYVAICSSYCSYHYIFSYCILRGRIKGFNSVVHAIKCQEVVTELWLGSYRTIESVADLGGLGGCSPPPPAISGNTKGWMCCYKNTLILANNDVLYISMHNNLYLPKDCTHHTP